MVATAGVRPRLPLGTRRVVLDSAAAADSTTTRAANP